MAGRLSPTMTLRQFENGYWCLDDLNDFAIQIGIPEAKRLRTTGSATRESMKWMLQTLLR
jgi:hypothetical protein